jgi:hypothetical protein
MFRADPGQPGNGLKKIESGVDLNFRVSAEMDDSSVVARRILTYRHQLVASPAFPDLPT